MPAKKSLADRIAQAEKEEKKVQTPSGSNREIKQNEAKERNRTLPTANELKNLDYTAKETVSFREPQKDTGFLRYSAENSGAKYEPTRTLSQMQYDVQHQQWLIDEAKKNGSNVTWNQALGRGANRAAQAAVTGLDNLGVSFGTTANQQGQAWAEKNGKASVPTETWADRAKAALQATETGRQNARIDALTARRNEYENRIKSYTASSLADKAMNSGGFASGSKYDPNLYNDKDFDLVYEQVNGTRRFQNWLLDPAAQSGGYIPNGEGGSHTRYNPEYSHLTPSQKSVFNYYYNQGDRKAALDYLDGIFGELEEKRYNADIGKAEKFASEHPVLASAVSPVGNFLGTLTAPAAIAQQAATGRIDPYSSLNAVTQTSQAMRNTVAENIAGSGVKGAAALSWLYQSGESILDNALRSTVLGGIGASVGQGLGLTAAGVKTVAANASLIPMALGVYQQTATDAKMKGRSDAEATAIGAIAAGAEYLTENISFDKLFDTYVNARQGARRGFRDWVSQMATEGMEEGASNIINSIADILILGDRSEWSESIRKYQASGMTEAEAKKQAFIDKAVEFASDVGGGVLSGGVMAGGTLAAAGIQASVNAAANRQTAKAAEEVKAKAEQIKGEVKAASAMTAEEWEASRKDQSDAAKKRRATVRESGASLGVSEDMIRSVEAASDVTGQSVTFRSLDYDSLSDEQKKNISREDFGKISLNGYRNDTTGEIVLNSNAKTEEGIKFILGHELGHSIEGGKLWTQLRDLAYEYYARNGKDWNKEARDLLAELEFVGAENFDQDSEMTANFAGKFLLDNVDSIEWLVNSNHSMATRVWNWINEKLATRFADDETATKAVLTRARELYGRALANNAKAGEESARTLPTANAQAQQTQTAAPAAVQQTQTQTTQTAESAEPTGEGALSAMPAPGMMPTEAQADASGEMSEYQQRAAELARERDSGEISQEGYEEELESLDNEYQRDPLAAYHEDMREAGLENERGERTYSVTAEDEKKVRDYVESLPSNVKFSVSAPVEKVETEDGKELIAVHNLGKDSLDRTLELGAFPAPSIAVVLDSMGHDMYGDYSVLFGRDTIDPKKNAKNRLFGGDAWTPTQSNARVEYELDQDKEWKLDDKLRNLAKQVAGGIFSNSSSVASIESNNTISYTPAELAQKLAEKETVKAAYLASKGETLDPVIQEKRWSRKFGNKYLQMYLREVNPQKLAQIYADLWEGKNAADALGDEYDRITQIIRQYYEDISLPMYRIMAEKKGWSQEELEEKIKERVDKSIDENVSIYTIEDFAKNAWEYYEDNGKTTGEIDRLATSDALDERVKSEDVKPWIYDQIKGLYTNSGIYNGKDLLTPSGNRRTFKQTHWETTAENIVKAMANAGESSVGAFGGSVLTESLPRYSSIEQMKADKGRLSMMEQSEYDKIINDIQDRISDVAERIGKINGESGFIFTDSVSDIMSHAASGKRTRAALTKAFAEEDLKINDRIANDIISIYNDAASVPTGYFEAKPMRVVGFDEVASIIAPDNEDAEYLDSLRNRGFNVETYKAGDREDRRRVVNDVADRENVKFSVTADINSPAFKEWFGDSKIVNEDGTPKVMYHGTKRGGYNVPIGGNLDVQKEIAEEFAGKIAEGMAENLKIRNGVIVSNKNKTGGEKNKKLSVTSNVTPEENERYMEYARAGDEDRAEAMVYKAAKSAGAATDEHGMLIDLYHGTRQFGFTKFNMDAQTHSNGMVYASTKSNVAANYAGRDHYAYQRNIWKGFKEGAEDLNDIIDNAKTVYGSDYKVITDNVRKKRIGELESDARKIYDRIEKAYPGYNSNVWQWDNEEYSESAANAFDMINGIFYELIDGDKDSESGYPEQPVIESLKYMFEPYTKYDPDTDDFVETTRYQEQKNILQKYLNEHRKEITAINKDFYELYAGYDLTDTVVDIEYNLLKLYENNDLLINSAGHINDPYELQKSMDEIHNIGAYHLYGFLGDNPLTIDAEGASWLGIKCPELTGNDEYYSTDYIGKLAKKNNYTSLIVKNVYDGGEKADDYIFFNADQLKSADPITYDDNGDIIPLSERFNPENDDIRWSVTSGADQTSLDNSSESEYNTLTSDDRVVWGSEGRTWTSGNEKVPFRYAIVPPDTLIVSNDEYGDLNPDYPKELQPRDRTRVVSVMDVNHMTNTLNPERLAESANAGDGAPIIRGDGVVVGGNKRVMSILNALKQGKAGEYESYIRDNAERFGIEGDVPEDGVLVRIAESDDWADLAKKLNESTTGAYSTTEQAQIDADRLDNDILSLLSVNEDGDLNTAANRDFISSFIENVAGESERAALVNADGYLSQQGLRRVQAAVFAKAYGDASLIARMSESLDDDMKNVTKALMQAASKAAVTANNIANGDAYDLDVTNEIIAGVELYAEAKKQKTDIDDIAGQMSLDEQKYGDAAIAVAKYIAANKLSGAKIADLFNAVYTFHAGLGSPNQAGLDLFGEGADNSNVTVSEIFRSAARRLLDESEIDIEGNPKLNIGFKIEDIGEQTSLPRNLRKGEAESINGNGNNTSGNVQRADKGRGRAKAQGSSGVILPTGNSTPDSGRYIDRNSESFSDIIREEAAKLGMIEPAAEKQMGIGGDADRVLRNAEFSSKVSQRRADAEARETKAEANAEGKEIIANSREVGKAYEAVGKEKGDRLVRNAQFSSAVMQRQAKAESKEIKAGAEAESKEILANAREAGKAYEAVGKEKGDRLVRNAQFSSAVMQRQAKAESKEIKAGAEAESKEILANAREAGKAYEAVGKEKGDRLVRNAQVTSKMRERESKRKADAEAKRIIADARASAKGIESNAREVGKAYEAVGRERGKAAEKKSYARGMERAEKKYTKMVRDFEAKQQKLADRKNEYIDLWNSVRSTEYKPIDTPSDALDLYDALKLARRNYNRSATTSGLTDREKAYVGRLIRGEEVAERLFEVPNIRYLKVLTVATNLYQYSQLGSILSDYRSHLRAVKNSTAMGAIAPNFLKMRDIPTGWLGDFQTPERVIEYITGDDYDTADLLKELYVKPIVEANANEVRLKDNIRDRVRKMNIDSTVRKGNKVSEDYAIQYLGELLSNAEDLEKETATWSKNHESRLNKLRGDDNTLMTEEQLQKLKEEQNKKPPERDGMTLEETRKAIADFKKENPNLDYNRIENDIIPQFREIYNTLFEMMNEVRVENGYEPVDYRKGYFPHYRRDDVSPLVRFARSLGMDFDTKLLPTTIQGLTQEFKPGINWFGNALKREGHETDYGVTEGIDRYIEGVSKVIYRTTPIQNMRALANTIRRLSDSKWQKRIDQIYSDRTMSDDEKYDKIEDEYRKQIRDEDPKAQRTALANMVTWLDENANTYAGKATYFDRGVRNATQNRATKGLAKLLTPLTNIPRVLVTKYGGNTVSINPGSWLTNFAPIFEAAAETNPFYAAKALLTMRDQLKMGDEFRDASNFITARFGSDTLVKPDGKLQRIVNTLATPMEWIDGFTSYVVTHTRYASNIGRGMSSEAALAEADEFAARLMADRSAGRLPIAMQHKNPLAKIFTQFQVENLNSLEHNTHDVLYRLKRRYKDDKEAAKALKVILHYLAFAGRKAILLWLCNELYESLVGRRFMPDPIDWGNEFIGDMTGKQMPNLINTGMEQGLYDVTGGKLGHDTAEDWNVKKDEKGAAINLAKNVAEELPMIGGFLGGGRFPVQTAYKDIGKLPKGVGQLFDEDDKNTQEAIANIIHGLSGPLTYLVLPGGGTFIKRIVQAAEQYAQGGVYSEDGKLKYPLYTDNPLEAIGNLGKVGLFGSTSTDAGQKWVDSGFNTFSKPATAAYQALVALDVPQRKAYNIVNKFRDVEKSEDESVLYERRQYIRGLDVSGEAKAALYETLVLDKNSRARDVLDTLDIMGADMNEAVNVMLDIADINRSNYVAKISKSKDIRDAICGSKLSGEDKLYIYENYGLGSNAERERAALDAVSQIDDDGVLVNLMNDIKSATASDDVTAATKKREMLVNSALSGEGKLKLFTDYMLNEDDRYTPVLNSLAAECDNDELTRVACELKESSKTGDNLRTLIGSSLPVSAKEEMYKQLVLTSQNRDKKTAQIDAFRKTGMGFDKFLQAALKYNELDNDDSLKPVQRATEFARWADTTLGKGADTAKETMKFSSGFTVTASGYEKMTDTGLSADAAYEINRQISALEPKPGKSQVSDTQKAQVIVSQQGLTDEEKLSALRGVYSEDSNTNYSKAYVAVSYGVPLETYYKVIDRCLEVDDDPQYASYKPQERARAVIDSFGELTNRQKAAIWQCYTVNWSAKSNPFDQSVGAYVHSLYYESDGKTRKDIMPGNLPRQASSSGEAAAPSSSGGSSSRTAAEALTSGTMPTASQISGSGGRSAGSALAGALSGRR